MLALTSYGLAMGQAYTVWTMLLATLWDGGASEQLACGWAARPLAERLGQLACVFAAVHTWIVVPFSW